MSSTILDYEDLIYSIYISPALPTEEITHYLKFENESNNFSIIEQKLILAALDSVLGKTNQAQDTLNKILPLSNQKVSFYVYLVFGFLFMKLRKFEKSTEYFSLAKPLSHTSKYPFILHSLVVDLYINTRNYTQGISYITGIGESPLEQSPVFQCKLGLLYEKLGNIALAQKCFIAASLMNFQLAPICELWAQVLAEENVSEKFENFFTTFGEEIWKINDLNHLKSIYLIKNEKYQEAVNLLKEFTHNNFKDSYLITLGFAFFKLNNITQAFVYTLKGLKANPKNAEGWFNLAVIYNRVQHAEGKKALIKAQKLGIALEATLEELIEPILPTIEIWNFGSQGVKRPEKPKKHYKEKTKSSELPKIIVPIPVKSPNISNNIGFPYPFLQYMYKMQEMAKRNHKNFEILQESKDFIEYNELANILTCLNLPAKRRR